VDSSARRSPRVWIGVGISLAAIGIALYRVDLGEAQTAFREANYIWLAPALMFAVGAFFLRAVRWRALFHPLELPLGRLFWIMSIGYTVTTILPLRLGDVVRAHLVGEVEEESKTRSFITIAVEHLMDVLTVLVILLVLSFFVPLAGWVRTMMFAATGIVVVSFILIGVTLFRRGESLELVDAALMRLPESWARKIHETFDSAIDGLSALGSPTAALKVAGWSAAQWLTGGLMMWAVLLAFDISASIIVALFMVAMSALALTIPSSPGYIGVYHAVMIEALAGVFGVSRGEAASFAVVSHLLLFVPPVIIGGLVLVRDPRMWDRLLRWREGESAERERESSEEVPARG
jgi:glycosyltransferase 2 family protein